MNAPFIEPLEILRMRHRVYMDPPRWDWGKFVAWLIAVWAVGLACLFFVVWRAERHARLAEQRNLAAYIAPPN